MSNRKRRRTLIAQSIGLSVVLMAVVAIVTLGLRSHAAGVGLSFIAPDGKPRGGKIMSEVVAAPKTREVGLMYRKELPLDSGMLFIYPKESVQSFWMHNTYVSLDMIFLDKDRVVVGFLENVPTLNDAPRKIDKPSMYVLEVPAGMVAAHQIGVGDKLVSDQPLPLAAE